MSEKKIRVVTHDAGFHTDDVFGVAALSLLLGDDTIEIIRTRNESVIDSAEYVLDVGFVYDEASNRFDHHQEAGAGIRDNGIPYASFGLVWKKYGAEICGSQEIANGIETKLVQHVDAYDNGIETFTLGAQNVSPFLLQDVVATFEPKFGEQNRSNDAGFLEAVGFARHVLTRLIIGERGELEIKKRVSEAYERAENKRCIVFDESFVADRVLIAMTLGTYSDTVYFIHKHQGGRWQLVCVVNPPMFYDNRKLLPAVWRGKHGAELATVTGVPDAFFCHRAGFMAVVDSKAGAMKLADLALAQ